jgi:hypothetical protein
MQWKAYENNKLRKEKKPVMDSGKRTKFDRDLLSSFALEVMKRNKKRQNKKSGFMENYGILRKCY